MAVTKLSNLSVTSGRSYSSLLAGNPAYVASSYESIATVTASGSTTTITFSSIPSGFKHLQVRGMGYDGGGYNIIMRFNGDTGNNYAYHRLYADGGTVYAFGQASQASLDMLGFAGYSNYMTAMVIDLLDYNSTTKNKTVRALVGFDENNTGGRIWVNSGLWINTSAVTSLSIINNGTNFSTSTTFALYGIKEA